MQRLAKKGELVELRSGHFVATRGSRDFVAGRVVLHRDGYGFLVPDLAPAGVEGDIFLPPAAARAAMHGDRALVRIVRWGGDGRAEGEIVRILRRAHPDPGGPVPRGSRRAASWCRSTTASRSGSRFPKEWRSPPTRANPDRIGAAGRKSTAPEDLHGLIVNIEIVEYPRNGAGGVGRVIEILGHPDDFGVDVEVIIRKHLPAPPLPGGGAGTGPAHFGHHRGGGIPAPARLPRHGRSSPSTAKRRAISTTQYGWTNSPNGHYVLQVHIADVSHYVLPGTPIDREASRARH